MRIRTYRPGDIAALVQVQQAAARFDGRETMNEQDFERLLTQSVTRSGYNVFLITDDDDELNVWGQGETLEGIEGEVVGYTILSPGRDMSAYYFRCVGAVLPEHRGRGAGHALLLCALNHARMQALDLLNEAHRQDLPIYFEIAFPRGDSAAERLARAFELEAVSDASEPGLSLYRLEL